MNEYCINRKSVSKYAKWNRGFTLAELLVVVAIIAVLVGIAIPIYTGQLEKSREAVDAANIRSQYTEVMMQAISTGADVNKDGNEFAKISLKQSKDAWQNSALKGSLHGLFASVVNDSILDNAEPSAKGSAWVEYVYESGKTVLHYSGSSAGTGDSPDHELQGSAAYLSTFLNTGSDSFGPDFTWENWGVGKNYSLGKALVSGRGNTDIKNALNAQGNSDAAAKAYSRNAEKTNTQYKDMYDELKNHLVNESGFDQLYSNYGAYTIFVQTKQDMDSFPTTGTVEVTEYLIVEGQRRMDPKYPTNGYSIIGVREVTYEMKNGKVINGYSSKVEDWTAVPVDSNSFNLN